jgi:predicted Rossmann-fold nucleotide-binding protein
VNEGISNQANSSYILISGSYQKNRANDRLCDFIGAELAKHDMKIISGGGNSADRVASSMAGSLDELNSYDTSKIVTVYRRKLNGEEIKARRVGTILFEGNNLQELRNFLFSKSCAIVIIGGAFKTREEVLIAQDLNMPVVPVEVSGGTASIVWQQHYKSGKYQDESLFLQLKSKNLFIAANAVVKTLTVLFSKERMTTIDSLSKY